MKYEIVIDVMGETKTKIVKSLALAEDICDSAVEYYGADCATVYDMDGHCLYTAELD